MALHLEELENQTAEILPTREVMQACCGSGGGKSWSYHVEDNDHYFSGNDVLNGNLNGNFSGNAILSGNSVSVGDVGSGNIVGNLLFGGGARH